MRATYLTSASVPQNYDIEEPACLQVAGGRAPAHNRRCSLRLEAGVPSRGMDMVRGSAQEDGTQARDRFLPPSDAPASMTWTAQGPRPT
ncbi:hypothetical protein MAPG_00356 [Magnaporthiopsis poae ATCC 64411]|uniref:Uncharacterized protein n=1 Tax=Magnaporthiopsis poae (strain ATCC 64411 / 73-15) TaxID=644358 RepID=A0A0C4DKS6_MAGP6|nr:hypothetical protein MAPG_00356 [Magnaporthiopsis poae ATCC 64411]